MGSNVSAHEARALDLGADELISLCAWRFRERPRKLKALRRRYAELCVALLRELARSVE